MVVRRASSVTLSRIAGHRYPSDDVEKASLLNYFSTSQEIALGHILIILNGNLESHQNSYGIHRPEYDNDFYLYRVVDIVQMIAHHAECESTSDTSGINCSKINNCDGSSDINNDNAGSSNISDSNNHKNNMENQSIYSAVRIFGQSLNPISRLQNHSVVTVKDVTTIGLKGRANCIVPNMKSIGDFIDFYLSRKYEYHIKRDSLVGAWTQIRNFLEPSVTQLHEVFSPIMHLAFTTKNDDMLVSSYDLVDQTHNYENINYRHRLNNKSAGHESFLHCIANDDSDNNVSNDKEVRDENRNSSFKEYSLSDCALFNLMKSPLLIESASGEDDMRIIAVGAAQKLGINVVTLDARIIFDTYSSTFQNKSLTNSYPLIYQDAKRPSKSNTADGTKIVNLFSPCILLIENFDSMIFSNQSNENAQAQNEENEIQEVFSTVLNYFFENLWSAMALNAKMKIGIDGGRLRDGLVSSMVLVTAVTRNTGRLKKNLKDLFPSELVLDPIPDNHINEFLLKNIKDNETEEAIVSHEIDNIEIRKNITKIVNNLSVEGGSGVSGVILKSIIDETFIHNTQRERGKVWLKDCGLIGSNVRSASSNRPSSSSILDSSQNRPYVPRFITEKDVRSASNSHSRTLVSMATRTDSGESVKVSPVHWGDIGGLDSVRKDILNILQLPSLRPDLFPAGCSRKRGILLYGPPGTGKTLVARAVATECCMAFISVKGPELLDVYVGESERNVRELFNTAHRCAPCVLFFDELDSLAPARGRGSDGGGVMDRVVSQLLTEIDGLSTRKATVSKSDKSKGISDTNVFIIGATNRPDLLDPALLRPGRFDRKIYLSVCKDVPARVQILEAQTRKFKLDDDVILSEIATCLPDTVTGADIGSLSSSAYGRALERKLNQLRQQAQNSFSKKADFTNYKGDVDDTDTLQNSKNIHENGGIKSFLYSENLSHYINNLPAGELTVTVSRNDFIEAVHNIKPSVTRSELDHYEALGKEFNDLNV